MINTVAKFTKSSFYAALALFVIASFLAVLFITMAIIANLLTADISNFNQSIFEVLEQYPVMTTLATCWPSIVAGSLVTQRVETTKKALAAGRKSV